MTGKGENDRETGRRHSISAIALLSCYACGPIIGYIIYETMLGGVGPQLLTLNTFFWLFVIFSIDRNERRTIWIWRPSISFYVVCYALGNLTYWYAFWIGLSSASTPLVLAALSLTMVVTPLMVRANEDKDERTPLTRILVTGLALVFAVILIKLDLTLDSLVASDQISAKINSASLYPLVCMALAVVAEGFTDKTMYLLRTKINEDKAAFMTEYVFLFSAKEIVASLEKITVVAEREASQLRLVERRANREVQLKSLPISLALALILMALHGRWSFPSDLAVGGWLFFWMFALGIVGSSAKAIFVTPLQGKGLDISAVTPLLAGRQLLYFVFAWITIHLFLLTDGFFWTCEQASKQSKCVIANRFVINLEILPSGNFTYWVGIIIAVSVWVIAWQRLWKIGFFTRKQG